MKRNRKRNFVIIGLCLILVVLLVPSCASSPTATSSNQSSTASGDATEPPSLLDMQKTNQAFAESGFTNIIGESERKATSQAYEALAPDDIPIKQERNDDLMASDVAVTYSIAMQSPASMSAWYKKEMDTNGWTYIEDQSTESNTSTVLVFEKEDRVATVNISRSTKGGCDIAIDIATK